MERYAVQSCFFGERNGHSELNPKLKMNEINIDFDITTLSFKIIMIVAIIAVMWLLQRGNHLVFS